MLGAILVFVARSRIGGGGNSCSMWNVLGALGPT